MAVNRPPTVPLRKNPEFIVSQILMVAATIIGVYLAANEGFKKAIQFQLLDADRTAYRHMVALRNEMAFNAQTLSEFSKEYRESGATIHDQFLPGLRTFVWDSSSEHPSVFDMPDEVLGGATTIYDTLRAQMERGGRSPDRRRELLNAFDEESARIETEMLPAFKRTLSELTERLEEGGIRLE